MKQLVLSLLIIVNVSCGSSQELSVEHVNIKEDLDEIITNLSEEYAYLKDKNIDLDCIREYYEKRITSISTKAQAVLFFEYLLDEFYDSHLILNTNVRSSYRLYSPIYATIQNEIPVIANVWQTQLENLEQDIIGAEILTINGIDIDDAMEQFPTHCNDKNAVNVREWIVNKIIAGRYNERRIITLKLRSNQTIQLDLDSLYIKQSSELLSSYTENNIGVIRINNTLGMNDLVNEFDQTLDKLIETDGLIIDIRNTVDGGNTYVARGIMSRFIDEPKPYQKHWMSEQYDGNAMVDRMWVEYVNPRGLQYSKPVVILVGRWTGSMGEGLAIGFEGIGRGVVVGSEMERLAGEMSGYSFKNQSFGYRLSTAKLFHIDGTPREKYVPKHYVKQSTNKRDETLARGIDLLVKGE